MHKLLFVLSALVLCVFLTSAAQAQVGYVTYYSPAPPCATPSPVVVTSYYAPAPVVTYQPVPVATTRWRPILGGTVTRIRTAYAPVVVTPAAVAYGY